MTRQEETGAFVVPGLQLRSLPALQRALLLEEPLETSPKNVRRLGLLSPWQPGFKLTCPGKSPNLGSDVSHCRSEETGCVKCGSWKGFCQVPLNSNNSIKVASILFMMREARGCQFMEGLMESSSGLWPLSEPSSPGSWVGGEQQLL